MTRVETDAVLRTAAGARAALRVRVTGSGATARHVVRAVGLDPSWSALPVLTGPLAADEAVDVDLPVLVPAGSPAGSFPFVVSVAPDTGPAVEVDVVLVVGDASRLALTLEPREPGGVRGRRFRVLLENGTTGPVTVGLHGEGPRELVLRTPRRPVVVPPGGAVRVGVSAGVSRRLVGPPRRFPFVVVAEGSTGATRVGGTFVAGPLLSAGVAKLLAVVAVLALWAGVSVVALGAVERRAQAPDRVAGGPAEPGDDDAGEGGAAGSGGKGNGGTGNVAPGGGRAEAVPVASSRLTGVVAGKDPGGVTVTLAPTRLPAEADQGASTGGLNPVSLRTGASTRVPSTQVSFPQERTVSPTRRTTTGADGTWAFAGVTRTGYYLLTFAKPGYQTQRFVLTRDGSPAPPMTTLLTAGRGSAGGRVLAEGRAVRGATITLSDGSSTLTTSTGSTGDEAGRWSVDGLSTPGTYLVSASAPGLALASRLVELGAGRAADGVDLVLRRGVQTLVGEVRQAGDSADGRGGVTITAVSGDTTRTATSLSSPSAGALAGGYSLPDLPLGDYVVTWSAPGHTSVTRRASLTGAAPSLRLPDVVLQTSGASLSGVVRSTTDVPLVGAGVALASLTQTYKITTADDGTYRFDGIEPGAYVLSVEKFGHLPAFTPVDVVAAQLRTLDVRLRPVAAGERSGTITGEVADARTTGVIPCPGDTACVTVEVLGTTPPRVAQSDGKRPYVVPGPGSPGLDAGQYRVRVSAPGYDSAVVPVTVPLDGVGRAARVALQPRGALVGTITPAAAAPLPPTCVVVLPSLADEAPPTPSCTLGAPDASGDPTCTSVETAACGVVGPKGEYRVAGLPRPGGYFAYVVPVGPEGAEWTPVAGALVVLEPGETERYDAQLSRRARLRLTLRAPASGGGLQAPVQSLEVVLTPAPGGTPPPRASYTTPAGDPGTLLVTGLEDGTYTVRATGSPLGGTTPYSGRVVVTVGTNQTTAAELVLTPTRPSVFVGRVQWTQDGQVVGVPGAQVTVTGTTGYTGTTPVSASAVARTNAAGCYAVTRDGTTTDLVEDAAVPPSCGVLERTHVAALVLTDPDVTVKADATGVATDQGRPVFGTTSDTAEAGTGLVLSTVPVAGVRFAGRLTSTPEAAAPRPFARTRLTLTSTAPGAGMVSLSSNADGVLSWTDPSASGPGVVRPGTYRLLAQLDGYDDAVGTLTCTRDARGVAAPCSVVLVLAGDVTLTVTVTTTGKGPVPGAQVTLTGDGVQTTTAVVPGGTTTVTFPGLSVAEGPYTVTARAAGFFDATRTTTLRTAAELDVPLELERQGSFVGLVTASLEVDGTATPLAGVLVSAVEASPEECEGGVATGEDRPSYSAVTGADGRYRITGSLERPGLDVDPDTVWLVSVPERDGFSGDLEQCTGFPDTAEKDEDARAVEVDFPLVAKSVTLEVAVYDDRRPERSPVTDATVVVQPTSDTNTVLPLVSTGPAHVYARSDLQPVGYVLTVTAPERAPLTTAIFLSAGQVVHQVEVLLADRRNSIAVQVLGQGPTGTPRALEDALVSVTPASVTASPEPGSPSPEPSPLPTRSPTPDCPSERVGSRTNAGGERQVTGLADGSYDVTVVGPDASWTCATRRLEVRHGALAALEVTLYQQLPSVEVTVVSEAGTSVDGVQVSLVAASEGAVAQGPQTAGGEAPGDGPTDEPSGPTDEPSSSTDEPSGPTDEPSGPTDEPSGEPETEPTGAGPARTLFLQVVPGEYLLTTTGPDLHLGSTRPLTVAASSRVGAPPQTVTATILEDRVQVRVAGDVPADVTVSSDAGPVVTVSVGSERRDVYVPSGATWRVRATAPGHQATVTPDSGSGEGDVLVQLTATATLTVEVTDDETEAPVDGAQVTATSDDDSATATSRGGTVVFRGLAPGTYTVTATTADGRAGQTTVVLDAGDDVTEQVVLRRDTGGLAVTVRRGVVTAEDDVTVVVRHSDGSTRTDTTGDDGRVTFLGLEPGSYTVTATATLPPGTGSEQATVLAGATTATTVTLTTPVETEPPATGTAGTVE